MRLLNYKTTTNTMTSLGNTEITIEHKGLISKIKSALNVRNFINDIRSQNKHTEILNYIDNNADELIKYNK